MRKTLTLLLLLLIATVIHAQKAKDLEGSIKSLKGITQFDLVFDYENVQIPKYDSEEDFLKDKMDKREEKEPGAGEKFKASWFADREERYEPKFIESFNKRFEDGEVKVGMDEGSDYVMKVKTTLLSAGYNVGVSRQNARIEAIISVYKKDAPNTVLYSVEFTNVEGSGAMGYDYDSGYRISEAYAKLAKEFAADLKKATK